MFLKLAYLPSKLRFSGKYLFYDHQISAGQLSVDNSATKKLYSVANQRTAFVIECEWIYANTQLDCSLARDLYRLIVQ